MNAFKHHLVQNVGNRLVLWNEKNFARNFRKKIFIIFFAAVLQKIANMYHADNMVAVFVAKRKTSVVVFFDEI